MGTDITERIRRGVADRAYHVCEYCLIHERDTFWGCEVDHVVSRKHGGASDSQNLAWACGTCNGYKGTDVATLIGQPPVLSRLFHPRNDRWRFCFELSGVRLEGLNQVGLATAKLLRLNEPNRLTERQELEQIGRYPSVEALARMTE